jgi:P-loop Domain of unknown function (DUF2791)
MLTPVRRAAIIDALRRGTVPREGLDAFAVGMDRFEVALASELDAVALGRGVFKAVRGEYGSGKTFFARWLQERARARGFATSEVQISETETPLHRMETIYRRVTERLATSDCSEGALRDVIDSWFFALEQEVLADGSLDPQDADALVAATTQLMERRLAGITRTAPAFSAALRTYRQALMEEQVALAEGLIAWLGGQPNVGAAIKRAAGIKGAIDHFSSTHFLSGLLAILKDSGRAGLLLVLDEVETLQRMRADTREKGLNALRQLLDEIDAGRYAGLYLLSPALPLSSTGLRAFNVCRLWHSACRSTLLPTNVLTTLAPCRSGCRASISSYWFGSVPGSAICSLSRRSRLRGCATSLTKPTSQISLMQ